MSVPSPEEARRLQLELAITLIASNDPKIKRDGAEIFLKYAEAGHIPSMLNYGTCLIDGSGVECNYAMAFKWYGKALVKGKETGDEVSISDAYNNLGACYYNGAGVDKNIDEARKYFYAAARMGNAKAKENIAVLNL